MLDLTGLEKIEEYQKLRKDAETTYFAEFDVWEERLIEESNRFGNAYFDSLHVLLNGATAPKFAIRGENVIRIGYCVVRYAKSELLAYLYCLKAQTTTKTLDLLEAHCVSLLQEIKTRKWESVNEVISMYFEPPPTDGTWKFIEKQVADFLWSGIQATLWRQQLGDDSTANATAVSEIGDHDKKVMERRALVDDFLLRCQVDSKYKVNKIHISLAVGHKTPRQFQFWQAASPKATAQDDKNFRRVLALTVPAFDELLRKKVSAGRLAPAISGNPFS